MKKRAKASAEDPKDPFEECTDAVYTIRVRDIRARKEEFSKFYLALLRHGQALGVLAEVLGLEISTSLTKKMKDE